MHFPLHKAPSSHKREYRWYKQQRPRHLDGADVLRLRDFNQPLARAVSPTR